MASSLHGSGRRGRSGPAPVRVLEGVSIPRAPSKAGEIDALVLHMAEVVFGCRDARLVWMSGQNRQGRPRQHQWPTTPLSQEEAALIEAALARRACMAGPPRGGWLRIAHALGYAEAVFLAEWPEAYAQPGRTSQGLLDFLALLASRMRVEIEGLGSARVEFA